MGSWYHFKGSTFRLDNMAGLTEILRVQLYNFTFLSFFLNLQTFFTVP